MINRMVSMMSSPQGCTQATPASAGLVCHRRHLVAFVVPLPKSNRSHCVGAAAFRPLYPDLRYLNIFEPSLVPAAPYAAASGSGARLGLHYNAVQGDNAAMANRRQAATGRKRQAPCCRCDSHRGTGCRVRLAVALRAFPCPKFAQLGNHPSLQECGFAALGTALRPNRLVATRLAPAAPPSPPSAAAH